MSLFSDIKNFIRISRPVNVLISVSAFGLSCYLAQNRDPEFLLHPLFWFTTMVISLIAAAGYWINDVYDFRIDRINKPGKLVVNATLSVKKVLSAYFILNFLVLLFSFIYFSILYSYYQITFINVISVFLLFIYAAYLKRIGVIGNLTIAFLVSLVILLAGYLYKITLSLSWVLMFSFQITFIREITKDIEDIEGDLAYNLKTLPIQVGISNTKRVLYVLYVVFLLSCFMPFFWEFVNEGDYPWLYLSASLLLVQAPMLYLIRLLTQANQKADYTRQSQLIKWVMLSGMVTVLLLP